MTGGPYKHDTIAAISTNPSGSALSIIRVSGADCSQIFKMMTKKQHIEDRHAYSLKLYSYKNDTKILDSVIAIFYRGPKSYTGEDVVEFICHGGNMVAKSIIQDLMDFGIRSANPGEFTLRAYLNNKIDLLSASSINALINAKSSSEMNAHLNNISEGKTSLSLTNIKEDVLHILTIIENELNFSEQEVDHISTNEIQTTINDIYQTVNTIVEHSVYGKESYAGKKIVIVGRPNVGKSTLFNALIGKNRAITSSVPGTTRDTIEAWFEISNELVCIVDTAGIWETKDFIEGEGIQRSIKEIQESDIVIAVDDIDPSHIANTLTVEHKISSEKIITVETKDDIKKNNKTKHYPHHRVSSINSTGIDKLINNLSTLISTQRSPLDFYVQLSAGQLAMLKNSLVLLDGVIESMEHGYTMDIIASEIRQFVDCIERVTGEVADEEVVNNIFKSFCVGK